MRLALEMISDLFPSSAASLLIDAPAPGGLTIAMREAGYVRRPLVLTGGPAVGKSTCGRALAEERPRASYIDVDDVRQLVVAGHEAPWAGSGGRDQHALGARNASALAINFLRAGFDVTIADMLSPATSRIYRESLPNCLIVHLQISLLVAQRRAATRTVYLTPDEFEALHRADVESPPEADAVLQVDGFDLEEQLNALRVIWN